MEDNQTAAESTSEHVNKEISEEKDEAENKIEKETDKSEVDDALVPPPTQQQQPSDVDDGKKTEGEDSQLENEDHRKHKQHDPIDSTATGTSDELFTGEDTETDRAGKDKNASSSDTAKNPDSKKSSRSSSREEMSEDSKTRRRKERRKKKHTTSVPKLRRKTSKIGNAAKHYLQTILMSYFQAFDPTSVGLCTQDDFWNILLSAELNLQLNQVDIQMVQNNLPLDDQGYVLYQNFAQNAMTLFNSIYSGQPDTNSNWVNIRSYDGTTIVSYNKKTGEVIDNAEAGMELFDDSIRDLFKQADTDNKGQITVDQFNEVVKQKLSEIKPEDREELTKMFPDRKISFADFKPIGNESILRYYRNKDDSGNEWTVVNTPTVGLFWLNVLTGETMRRDPNLISGEREQEAALINEAYSQIDSLNLQLQQEKLHTRELENQIALTTEELEATATQLDETGKQLDEINLELQLREAEVSQLQTIITEKDQYIDELTSQVTKVVNVKEQLSMAKAELQEMKTSLQAKNAELAGKEQTIEELKLQSGSIIEELKNAHGVIDARESSIDTLQYNLTNEQGTVKQLTEKMPSLENRLTTKMNELMETKNSLDEKTAILLQTRESLKKARMKNTELMKQNSKLSDSHAKLKNAESEIKTLKSFLVSKTVMVEKKKKEVEELKLKLTEIESKDDRRAIILADVLEKTARAFQHQLMSPRQHTLPTTSEDRPSPVTRPISAPLVPLEEVAVDAGVDPLSMSYGAPIITKTTHPTTTTTTTSKPHPLRKPKSSLKKRGHVKSHTVPIKLPPIQKKKSDFIVPTDNCMKKINKQKDSRIHPHTDSVNCQCEMCTLNRRSPRGIGISGYGGTGAGLSRLALENDQKEYLLSKQLKIGQRVLIQIKKSMFDVEPQKLTGIVKYVGRIDSEYMDNKIYVGVKLDDAVGNTDGIYKGRRYFTCPPQHGRMVRITSVIAVMPNKGLTYKPLQLSSSSVTATGTIPGNGRVNGGTGAGGSPYSNNGLFQHKPQPSVRVV